MGGAGRGVAPARASHLSLLSGARGCLPNQLQCVKEVTVAENLSRESTSLAFFLGAGGLEAAVKGESGAARAGLGGGGTAHIKGRCFGSSFGKKPRKHPGKLHARGGMAGAPGDQPGRGERRGKRRVCRGAAGEACRREPHTWGSPSRPCRQGRVRPYQWAWGIQSVQPW